MNETESLIPVKVALRIRPPKKQTEKLTEYCVLEEQSQIRIGKDKSFTFDYIFSSADENSQQSLYEKSVKDLLNHLFKGYNVTVLAYGQTSTGKTYTIGTDLASFTLNDDLTLNQMAGVIPRVLIDMFKMIQTMNQQYKFEVSVSFVEIYNEEINDLLSSKISANLDIREDLNNSIRVVNLTELIVADALSAINLLKSGSALRIVGDTAMNEQSSRSHAIFTINLTRESLNSGEIAKSKFHLVDLAGSERQSKTKAEGLRFRESININLGLLALGNVISILGDENKSKHVPYRESKLTRLLQDSLGGNSHTLMIACISIAACNLDESINTLRYADRARKIKNKPIVNIDSKALEIIQLKKQIEILKQELIEMNENTAKKITNEKQLLTQRLLEQTQQHQHEIKQIKMQNELREAELNRQINELKHLNEASLNQLNQFKQQRAEEKEHELNLFAEKLDSKLNEEYLLLIKNHRESLNRLVEEKNLEQELFNTKINELNEIIENERKTRVKKPVQDAACQTLNSSSSNEEDVEFLLNKIHLLQQLIASKDAHFEQEFHRLQKRITNELLNSSNRLTFDNDESYTTTTTTTTMTTIITRNSK